MRTPAGFHKELARLENRDQPVTVQVAGVSRQGVTTWCWYAEEDAWAAGGVGANGHNNQPGRYARRLIREAGVDTLAEWAAYGEAIRRYGPRNVDLVCTDTLLASYLHQHRPLKHFLPAKRRARENLPTAMRELAGWRREKLGGGRLGDNPQALERAEALWEAVISGEVTVEPGNRSAHHAHHYPLAGPAHAYAYGGTTQAGDQPLTIIYTDGSTINETSSQEVGGWAWVTQQEAQGVTCDANPYRAEATAILEAIRAVNDYALVFTDNNAVAQAVNTAGPHNTKDPANQELIDQIRSELTGRRIWVGAVAGHAYNPGNRRAHHASRRARQLIPA